MSVYWTTGSLVYVYEMILHVSVSQCACIRACACLPACLCMMGE